MQIAVLIINYKFRSIIVIVVIEDNNLLRMTGS